MTRIQVLDGENEIETRELSSGTLKVGRDPQNDLVLADPSVSRFHAEIEPQGGFYLVRDQGSTNGTFINDMLVRARLLSHGDLIRVGRFVLRFDSKAAPGNESTRVRIETLDWVEKAKAEDLPQRDSSSAEELDHVGHRDIIERHYQVTRNLWGAIGYMANREQLHVAALDFLLETLEGDRAALIDYDSRRDGVWSPVLVRVRGEADATGADIRIDTGALARMTVVGDVVALPLHTGDTSRRALIAPLHDHDVLFGAIYLDREASDRSFDEHDQRLLGLTARQIAVAAKNAALVDDLLAERGKTQAILTSLVDGVLVCDEYFRVTDANIAATVLLGLEERNPLSRPLEAVLADFRISPDLALLSEESRRGGATFQLEPLEFKADVASRSLTGFIVAFYREDGEVEGYVVTMRDATESRRLERIKNEFICNVAHKLRTPLTVVQADVPLLRERGTDGALAAEIIDEVERNTFRLSQIVDQFVEFTDLELEAAKDGDAPTPTHLAKLIREAELAVAPQAKAKRIEIVHRVDESLPTLLVRPRRLRTAIERILENAVKFADEGTQVRIESESTTSVVKLHIMDEGPGIPPEHAEAVFYVGHQIDENRTGQVPGAGLGLSIARHVLEQHGGDVRITSPYDEVACGTKVTLILPTRAVGSSGMDRNHRQPIEDFETQNVSE
jgi:signal transduction histidine kinase